YIGVVRCSRLDEPNSKEEQEDHHGEDAECYEQVLDLLSSCLMFFIHSLTREPDLQHTRLYPQPHRAHRVERPYNDLDVRIYMDSVTIPYTSRDVPRNEGTEPR